MPCSVQGAGHDADAAIGAIPEQFFIDAARGSDLAGADAIFLACTGTRALNVIETIESYTRLPVVTSNQAAFWHALRLAGWSSPIDGFGRRLREIGLAAPLRSCREIPTFRGRPPR